VQLDHLTIIAPNLELGATHVRDLLGVDLPFGGCHLEMGTHNLLTRLSDDVFLEVIAVDPLAGNVSRPRWFGLDDNLAVQREWNTGLRLRGWVVRTNDIDKVLTTHGSILGQKIRVSRGDRSWLFSVPPDGSLPLGGVAPSVIDWGVRGSPAVAMADHGLTLLRFWIEHPDPDWVEALYGALGAGESPVIRKGNYFRYRAVINTPMGVRELW
jgi:Glyoxalase-like domain